jgi:hypothetical protein
VPGAGTTVALYLPRIDADVDADDEDGADAPQSVPAGLRV